LLFEANKDGLAIFFIDEQGNPTPFIECNESAGAMIGYTPEEFKKFTIADLETNPDNNAGLHIAELLKRNGIAEFETEIKHKNGHSIHIEVKAIAISYQNKPAILNITRDVTERKKAERELRQNQERLSSIFRVAPTGIGVTVNRILTEANPQLSEMTGYLHNELVGQSARLLYPTQEECDYVGTEKYRQIAENGTGMIETTWLCKNGEMKHILLSSTPIVHGDLSQGVTFTALDITQRKIAESINVSRLKLMEFAEEHTLPDLLKETLSEVETLTNSQIAFYHFFDSETGTIKLNQWSEKTSQHCALPRNLEMHYPIESAGIWTECINKRKPIIHNDVSKVPNKKGVPEGHPAVVRELTVPIIRNKKVVALLGVGNKPIEYTQTDVDIVSQLADLAFDIAESKQAREWLVESEKSYRNLFENITQGFALHEIILDETGVPVDYRFISVNPAFEKLTGLKAKDIIGKRVKEVLPGTEAVWIETYGQVALTGHPIHYQDFAKELNKHFEIWAFSPERGKFAVVFSDVTSRINAEAEARKLAAGIMQSPASVVITDKFGTIEFVNPRFTEVTGYDPHEAIGNNPRILKSGKQDNDFYRKMWETIKSGNNWRGEMINKKKNGDLYWEYAIITPVTNDKNEITNFIAIKEDISDRKEKELLLASSERKLREQNDELKTTNENLSKSNELILEMNQDLVKAREKAEESDKLKTAFLANISHEIRTPLNGIIGFTKLLGKASLTPEKYAQFLKIINASSLQLVNIVDDVIDIAKVESGQIELHKDNTPINEEIGRILNLLRPQAEQKNIVFKTGFEKSDEDSKILTDKGKFNQIVTNLVNNALKFTEQGNIEVGYKINEAFIHFYVQDSGIGISQKHHKTIFERFRQVELEETRKYGGTGLGLSICKAFVEAMGGKIWVESELGQGSTFYFTLPYMPVNAEQRQTEETENVDLDLSGFTVLIAEDEETNMMFMHELFGDTNATVMKAYNGVEAVEMARQNEIHLILMDIKMPEMDGLSATRFIKADKPQVSIIATTAYALGGDKERCLKAGCDGYISKPIDRDELFGMIRQLLGD
jgi:hypothetical protein